jgi:hypothetical protein
MTARQKRSPIVRWWWATYLLSGALAAGSAVEERVAVNAYPNRGPYFNAVFAHDALFMLSRLSQIAAATLAVGIVWGVQGRLRAGTLHREGPEVDQS